MLQVQYVCDLCGEPIDERQILGNGARRFRIRERKMIIDRFGWYEIDCHDECAAAVAAAARERMVRNDKG